MKIHRTERTNERTDGRTDWTEFQGPIPPSSGPIKWTKLSFKIKNNFRCHGRCHFSFKKADLVKADTPFKLCKLDNHDKDNMSLQTNVKLVTSSATECLKEVPSGLHKGLKKSRVAFLTALIDKIEERSPLKYKLIRVAAALDPIWLPLTLK